MIRLSREQVRRVDRICIDEYGLPGIVLMENAARSAAEAIDTRHREGSNRPGDALILCGGGNNGGDGYAVARLLKNRGWRVTVLTLVPIELLKGDAAIMAGVVKRMAGVTLTPEVGVIGTRPPGVTVIDALFGTGLERPIEGAMATAIRAVNESGHEVVALDLPSGLDCDTGEPLGDACVRASMTVTFVAEKLGFANPRSRAFTGDIVVGDIGCPREVVARVSNP